MKRNKFLVLLLLLVISLFIPVGNILSFEKEDQEIKIGAILPLSGPSAQYGQWIQEGLNLAKEEVNASGGINGKTLQIIYEDDQADPKIAANAMQKLTSIDKVPLVYGSWASSSVLAQAPIAEKTKTVLMAEAISPKIRDAGDYVFRMQPDARYYIRQLVPFIYNKLKIKKVSILNVNNDFGIDQAKVFTEEFTKLGGQVLSTEVFEQGASDFKTELIKIKAKKPEAIFAPGYTELAVILKQAKELRLKQRFFASVPFENPQIIQAAGNAAEDVIYPHHFDPDAVSPLAKAYQKAYISKYGRQSEGFAALAYDGLKIVADVLTKVGTNSEKIRNALYQVKDFPGVTGNTTFDDHGDVLKPIIIKTVKNGRFSRYE